MSRPRRIPVVLVAAGLSLAAILPLRGQGSRGTREHSLYVTVVDANGAPVPDVGPSDLLVKEDNLTREVLRVTPATDPMSVAVLVDTSQAARNVIQYMRQALPPFAAELTKKNSAGKENEVAIIG